ncbi:MAG: PD-(D/E)XK nuclease family protein [Aureliella sp.]
MLAPCVLTIRLTPGAMRPGRGVCTINELCGGPETLLGWLETQLGLPAPQRHRATLVTEYATALSAVDEAVFAHSFQTDRWAVASELLARRDGLLQAGWNERPADAMPTLVNDMARATGDSPRDLAGVSERLCRVLGALDAGQRLPEHRCRLVDPISLWPKLWQDLLSQLNVEDADEPSYAAAERTALHAAQQAVRGGKPNPLRLDGSLRLVRSLSQTAAVEFIAATLAADPQRVAGTTILCEDDYLAVQLDAALERRGVPTVGATVLSPGHPALQILPLSLGLCWSPVDPQALLDFLSLHISPIPRRAATRLAAALAEEPGMGSGRWESALRELCSSENDPQQTLTALLDQWLSGDRVRYDQPLPASLVRSRCALVARWAAGRSAAIAKGNESSRQLVAALQTAAAQAALLGELAESHGGELTKPQLERLVEEALRGGVETSLHVEADGGPVRARSLAEIDAACERLIWLGVSTGDTPPCCWSTSQLAEMTAAGLDVDDGSRALSALRAAEAAGFCRIQQSALVVMLPQDEQRRWHPLWLAICGSLEAGQSNDPPVLEGLIESRDLSALAPFRCGLQSLRTIAPQPLRSHWQIPGALLRDRKTVSASELQDRLACPLKWVLDYQARLRPSPIARLPDDYQLKGNFCHRVLQLVFGAGGGEALPEVEAAVEKVLTTFDARIGLDAAPLARPDRTLERERLRKELECAARVLVQTLQSGGYAILGIEVGVTGRALGKELVGSIDCLVQRSDGCEAIIDFKYSGPAKYTALIAEGKAVQLATYAYGRHCAGEGARKGAAKRAGKKPFPPAAYLILSDGLLVTPSGSPIAGDHSGAIIEGPSIDSVWKSFERAIRAADSWMDGSVPIAARPHLEVDDWPEGAHIVLDSRRNSQDVQAVCRYCAYTQLCGIEGLS